MFFCEKCQYLYNVTKDIKSKQIGGKITEALNVIFHKFTQGEKIVEKDLKKITGKDLMENEHFESLNKKDQRKLISTIKALDKNFFAEEDPDEETKIENHEAYFICKFCENYKPIKPGTLIYSKNYGTSGGSEIDDYRYAIYDSTLPRTRNYICQNSECETHKKDSLKEAVLTKNMMDQIVYICTVCSTHWVNSV